MGWWEKRYGRVILFWTFNFVAVIGVFLLVIQPARGILAEQANEVSQRSEELARYKSLAEAEPKMRALFNQGRDEREGSIFLTGNGEGAASASLQARLKELGERAGLQIRSIAALEPRTENAVRYLGAQMDVNGPIAAVRAALQNLQNAVAPVLFVEALAIRAPAMAPGDPPQHEQVLSVQIEVYGAIQNAETAR